MKNYRPAPLQITLAAALIAIAAIAMMQTDKKPSPPSPSLFAEYMSWSAEQKRGRAEMRD